MDIFEIEQKDRRHGQRHDRGKAPQEGVRPGQARFR
jgi:hypothetical protein